MANVKNRKKESKNIVKNEKKYKQRKTNKELMRVCEVAAFFSVSERTVYLWLDNGHLAGYKTPGGTLRITRESVENCQFRKKEDE